MIIEYLNAFQEETRKLNRQNALARVRVEKELSDVNRKIHNLVNALAEGMTSAASVSKMLIDLERQKEELQEKVKIVEMPDVALHPASTQKYIQLIERLTDPLDGDPRISSESAAAFRDVVSSVVVHASKHKGRLEIAVESKLSALLNHDIPPFGRFVGGSTGAG